MHRITLYSKIFSRGNAPELPSQSSWLRDMLISNLLPPKNYPPPAKSCLRHVYVYFYFFDDLFQLLRTLLSQYMNCVVFQECSGVLYTEMPKFYFFLLSKYTIQHNTIFFCTNTPPLSPSPQFFKCMQN